MKLLLMHLILFLFIEDPVATDVSAQHTMHSGNINLMALQEIESLICKKAGAELNKNSENSFVLNGYDVFTRVTHRLGSKVYEESFYEIENPDNICRMRLVITPEGDWEFAVMIPDKDGYINYHAVFDPEGKMIEDDPWGISEGYTIETFDLYNKYRSLYSEKVDRR